MFNLAFLHVVREYECRKIVDALVPRSKVLEIGGGSGYQARRLQENGFSVSSIELSDSIYSGALEFPVTNYDGSHIPFKNASFDIVFSSNVLEHVKDLPELHREIIRVLKPGGYCVHVMPTGAWRFWTNLAHYTELIQRIALVTPRLLPRSFSRSAMSQAKQAFREIAGTLRHYAIVSRHGETGNALTEIFTFGTRHWVKHFTDQGFEVREVKPIGLFYTGHMVLGNRLSLSARQSLARFLGSACAIYSVAPNVPR